MSVRGVGLQQQCPATGFDRLGDASPILRDVRRVVTHVVAEVERLVGTYAHPAEAVGHERFDTPLAKGLGAVDSKKTALFAVKLQWDWHVGQIPLSSSTWRRSR